MFSSKVNRQAFHIIWHPTVKPVLSGHPLLSGQQPKSPILFPLFTLNKTFIRRTPLLSRPGHLKSDLKWSFLLLPTCIKRTLVIKFHHPTSQTPEMLKSCLELSPTNFLIFVLNNVTWRTDLISFLVQYCFLFRFVCTELFSLIWFLQIWVAIYVQGTMINWSTLIKEFMQTYIVIVSGSILTVSTVHLNGIWHLICHYLLKPELGGHPVLSRHYSIPQGCLLNTGFTVFIYTQILDLFIITEIMKHSWIGRRCMPKKTYASFNPSGFVQEI